MIKNLKVDIIYYMVGTDFEMEFNLGGCAQMRLLTDTVETRSDFSKALARSVGRSNIIIACGPVFGERGLINTVATITNIGKEFLNKQKYGVDSYGEIEILKGSTPLVTSEGIFGGCIIENGKQVIVILSESKSLRKQIMKELIHPYITQWSFMMSDEGEAKPVLPVENVGGHSAENPEIPMPAVTPEGILSAEETVNSKDTQPDDSKTEENENEDIFSNSESDKALDGFVLNDGEDEQENTSDYFVAEDGNDESYKASDDFILSDGKDESKSADKPVFTKEEFEKKQGYYSFDFSDSDDGSVIQKNYRYLVEDYEDENPKSSGKGFFVVSLILTILIALAIIFFVVVRPLILGYDLPAYLKNIFKTSETALVKCFFL